jgi:hypothetical protein
MSKKDSLAGVGVFSEESTEEDEPSVKKKVLNFYDDNLCKL